MKHSCKKKWYIEPVSGYLGTLARTHHLAKRFLKVVSLLCEYCHMCCMLRIITLGVKGIVISAMFPQGCEGSISHSHLRGGVGVHPRT